MKKIIVKSQQELNEIPETFEGEIWLEFMEDGNVVIINHALEDNARRCYCECPHHNIGQLPPLLFDKILITAMLYLLVIIFGILTVKYISLKKYNK